MWATGFFSEEEKKLIKNAVIEAEQNTSGEIRVHIEVTHNDELMDRAATVFAKLKMHETKLRNGVLFYIALKNRQFAILGDVGINMLVPDDFWNQIADNMTSSFMQGAIAEGICDGIKMAGLQLKEHFPRKDDDVNELTDDISYGDLS